MTATQSVPIAVLVSSARQHENMADKLFARIAACANAGRKQLELGQPAGPPARQIGADLMELMAELGKLAEDARFTGHARQRTAA